MAQIRGSKDTGGHIQGKLTNGLETYEFHNLDELFEGIVNSGFTEGSTINLYGYHNGYHRRASLIVNQPTWSIERQDIQPVQMALFPEDGDAS